MRDTTISLREERSGLVSFIHKRRVLERHTSTPWVLSVTHRVILGGGLDVPDVTTVSTELARLEGLSNILLDNNGTTGSVDEPCT